MPLTPQQARDNYRRQVDALQDVIDHDNSTEAQMREASDAIRELNTEFVANAIQEIEALSTQYAEFIAYMEDVVKKLESGGPLEAVEKANAALDHAKELLPA